MYLDEMPGLAKPKLSDRLAFPSSIRLPDLADYTREFFDSKINPHWKEAETASYAWFDSYGIHSGLKRDQFFDFRFGLMSAFSYPHADLEHLRPAMDFTIWLFAFDDMTDEGNLRDKVKATKTAIEITMNVLRNPDSAETDYKIAASLQSVFDRMRANSSPGTIKRFVDSTELYTQAILQQNVNRSFDEVPTVEQFIQLRRDTSAVKMVFAVLEYSLNINLPDEVHDDPIIAELELAANDILTWANDIYSFPKEQAQGDTQNLVFIAMWDRQLDLEGAMDYVNQLTRKRVDEYLNAKQKLRSFGPNVDPQVADYVQGMEYLAMGTIEWTFMTPRYFGASFEEVKDTGVVEIKTSSAPSADISAEGLHPSAQDFAGISI